VRDAELPLKGLLYLPLGSSSTICIGASSTIAMANNPVAIDSRFEIRKLDIGHLPWVLAIVAHSTCLCSPLWNLVYPDNQIERAYEYHVTGEYLISHGLKSGISYGVFDKEYKFKRPESAATGGKLYWDYGNETATKDELLEQMDFPLVSVALSYDAANPLDMEKMGPVTETMPLFGTLYVHLTAEDKRGPSFWGAKPPGEILIRGGTATRSDCEGLGLMKGLTYRLMREAARDGYQGIHIDTAHEAVNHVWEHPPEPFKASVISTLDASTFEEEREGRVIKPFAPSTMVMKRIYVAL
jgi:hypothetical protein